MIPIITKDLKSFYAICKSYGIPEGKAQFIDGTKPTEEWPSFFPVINEKIVKIDGSDWLDYKCSY